MRQYHPYQPQQQYIDNDVILSHNIDSWKSYTYIYDVAIDHLLNLHVPTIQDFQKVLSSEIASEQVIRSAFYSAFYTKQKIIKLNNQQQQQQQQKKLNYNNNKNIEIIYDENQLQQEIIEDIFINQSWLDYFSSRIQYKSSNSCLFKVKKFKKNTTLDDVFGGGLQQQQQQQNKHKNEQYSSNNLFKKIKTEEMEMNNNNPNYGFYFNSQDNNNEYSNIFNNGNNNDNNGYSNNRNNDDHLKVDDDSDESTVLKYRYEKDFVLVKDGKPHIITLSPDWGIPFHFKSEVSQQQEIDTNNIPGFPTLNNNNKNNINKNKNNNNNNNNNNNKNNKNNKNKNNGKEDDSWCGLM